MARRAARDRQRRRRRAHRGRGPPRGRRPRTRSPTRARERGAGQLGTLGSGNHFLEVQRVEELIDRATAARVRPAHGPGHGADPLGLARARPPGVHRLRARDGRARSAATASSCPTASSPARPLDSAEGRAYLGAMAAAANFAWANRHAIAHGVRGRRSPTCSAPARPPARAGLRRRPQHRQARGARRAAPCASTARARPARSPASRCSSPAPWARRATCSSGARADGALVRHGLPRRRPAPEPHRGASSRSRAPSCAASSRRRASPCARRRRGPRRGGPVRLQGRRARRARRRGRRARGRVARLRPIGVVKG